MSRLYPTYTFLFLLIILSMPVSNYADWDFSLAYEKEYNSNPFRSVETSPSWIGVYDVSVSKTFTNNSIGYYGNYGNFGQLSARNFYWHELAWWGYSGGTSYGLNVEQRLNTPDYAVYNYQTATAYLLHRIYTGTGLWQFDGSAQTVFYPEIKAFNYLKVNAGAYANKAFPTKTTLIVSSKLYFKQYLTESVPGITQLYGRLRIAQSVTSTTGIAVQYSQRILLGQAARTITEIPYTTYQESEIFNDPMSYNGQTFGTEITQLLPYQILVKAAVYEEWRQYIGQPAYIQPDIYDQSVRREDRSTTAWVYLEKTFDITLISQNSLTMSLTFQWKENQSNSYWYKYSINYGALGIRYIF